MALTKSLRDEENERINNILKRLIGLDYVPGFSGIDDDLSILGLNSDGLAGMTSEEAIVHVKELQLDWPNAEMFADFLVSFGTGTKNVVPLQNAVAVYNYIQDESKMFSFGIFNKIAVAKSQL